MRRRPLRRPFRRTGLRGVPPELKRANKLMEAGNYNEAATAFEKIARLADARRGPRAPHFHLRAGRAYILDGQTPKGMEHLKRGLSAFAARRQWEVLDRIGQRSVNELNEHGLVTEAQEIADYLQKTLPEMPVRGRTTSARATLPTHCPGCGGPIRLDEVEWLDNLTAECIYCGSPVRGEN